MKIKTAGIISLILACLYGCGETSDLGSGFYLMDQGGSKTSLAKDGIILINYTVTGVGKNNGLTLIESREYYSSTCIYHVIDHNNSALLPLDKATLTSKGIALGEATQSIEPINSRSCKHNVDGSSRGL